MYLLFTPHYTQNWIAKCANTTAHIPCWLELSKPIYAWRSLACACLNRWERRSTKMQPYPLILQNTGQLAEEWLALSFPQNLLTSFYLFPHFTKITYTKIPDCSYCFLLVFFCISVQKPKRPATDVTWKPPKLLLLFCGTRAKFRPWLFLHWFLSNWFHMTIATQGFFKACFFYGDGVVSPNPQPEGPGYLSLSDTLLKPVRREWPYQQLGCHQQGIQDIKTVKVQCMNSVPVRALSHSSDRLPFCCSVYFASQSA